MSEFNFKSAICTSRSQSEKLLALGLKKETADMMYDGELLGEIARFMPHKTEMDYFNLWDSVIPAWSLHRLLSLYNLHYIEFMNDEEIESVYDIVIDAIEHAIKEGYFNKDYLQEQADSSREE